MGCFALLLDLLSGCASLSLREAGNETLSLPVVQVYPHVDPNCLMRNLTSSEVCPSSPESPETPFLHLVTKIYSVQMVPRPSKHTPLLSPLLYLFLSSFQPHHLSFRSAVRTACSERLWQLLVLRRQFSPDSPCHATNNDRADGCKFSQRVHEPSLRLSQWVLFCMFVFF